MAIPLLDEPHEYDFKLYQGVTWSKNFQWIYGSANVDLTGTTGEARFKVKHSDTAAAFTATYAIVNATTGQFSLSIAAATTSAVNFSTLFTCYDDTMSLAPMEWECDITDGTNVTRVIKGKCRFQQEV